MADAPERTAVLVIRAWLEDENDEELFRARITSTLDASTGPPLTRSVAVASEQDALRAVQDWLQAFAVRR